MAAATTPVNKAQAPRSRDQVGLRIPNLVIEQDGKEAEFRVQLEVLISDPDVFKQVQEDLTDGSTEALLRVQTSVLPHIHTAAIPVFRLAIIAAFNDNLRDHDGEIVPSLVMEQRARKAEFRAQTELSIKGSDDITSLQENIKTGTAKSLSEAWELVSSIMNKDTSKDYSKIYRLFIEAGFDANGAGVPSASND